MSGCATAAGSHNLDVLNTICYRYGWKLTFHAAEQMEGLSASKLTDAFAIVCNGDASTGHWKKILHSMPDLKAAPAFIVISSEPRETLIADVLAEGGFDVLGAPLEETEAEWVLLSAWLNRRHETARPWSKPRLRLIGTSMV